MISLNLVLAFFTVVLLALATLQYRLSTILDTKRPKPQRGRRQTSVEPTHLLIVLGSGGHTAEMIAMLQRAVNEEEDAGARLDWGGFTHRTWVVSSGDGLSAERARQFEDMAAGGGRGTYDVQVVPRAREIHQPLYTAPVSSLRCVFACARVLGRRQVDSSGRSRDFPDVILCNGPATATIMVFTSTLLRFFDVGGCNTRGKMRTIYVESFARVKKLSLSGRLLSRVVDRFLVQWPQLQKAEGRAEYRGILV